MEKDPGKGGVQTAYNENNRHADPIGPADHTEDIQLFLFVRPISDNRHRVPDVHILIHTVSRYVCLAIRQYRVYLRECHTLHMSMENHLPEASHMPHVRCCIRIPRSCTSARSVFSILYVLSFFNFTMQSRIRINRTRLLDGLLGVVPS